MTVPERIARLPRDPRGYPIPWNVLREGDTAFFTVNDDRKAWRALREGLCPICGERLGKWLWFVGGLRSAFDPGGCYIDLPGHRDCMEFALQTCPYLAAPKYLGRIDIVHPEKLPPQARVLLDETIIPDRPEIFVAVACEKVEALDRGLLVPYLKPVAPFLDYTFWRHGQQIPAHRAMPILRGIFGAEWELSKEGGLMLCGFCQEPVETGASPIRGAQPLHQECGLRLVIGSVAHLERRCGCFVPGSEESDPTHMTLRQAAQAAVKLWALQQARN